MAVPKRKTSKSKRDQRRAHDYLKPVNIIEDKKSGEYRLSHHMCKKEGTYNGKQITKIVSEEETADVKKEE